MVVRPNLHEDAHIHNHKLMDINKMKADTVYNTEQYSIYS